MPLICIQCKNETSSTTNDMCERCYQQSPDFKRKRESKFKSNSYIESSRRDEETAANDTAMIAMLATVIAAGEGM